MKRRQLRYFNLGFFFLLVLTGFLLLALIPQQVIEVTDVPLPQAVVQNEKIIDAPYINQRAQYPTGCESVCAVMALHYWGVPITVEDFIDHYLVQGRVPVVEEDGNRYGDDPYQCFLGSPYSKAGWGCYAPVISRALRRVLNQQDYRIEESEQDTLEELCKAYIDREIPVIVWTTLDMQQAKKGKTWMIYGTERTCTWTAPSHCMLLVGYDESYYYFNDPWQKKKCRYLKGQSEQAFQALGKQSVVILPQKQKDA